MWRAISIVGMLLLVIAYVANQRGATSATSPRYLLANIVGAAMLAAYSAVIGEWVFVLLEGFWCGAAVWTLAQVKKSG
jgi:uncharacterized membrane protein